MVWPITTRTISSMSVLSTAGTMNRKAFRFGLNQWRTKTGSAAVSSIFKATGLVTVRPAVISLR